MNQNKIRLAFLSDLHFEGGETRSQSDFGGSSQIVLSRAKKIVSNLNPDLIFILGDMTAFGRKEEWLNYKKWISEFDAPVYDVFGNHDRNYSVHCEKNDGEEYFTELGRTADTKTIRLGNFVFILVSEENNPAGSEDMFNVIIPDKRLNYIKQTLEKYAANNNVFVISHTPPAGTTVYSTRWMTNNPEVWIPVSKKLLDIYSQHPVLAHLSGHTHIDYRLKRRVIKLDGKKSKEKRGKFVKGDDKNELPDTYFLNLPSVDTAHGWMSGRIPPALLRFDDSYKDWNSFARRVFTKIETINLSGSFSFFDFLSGSKLKSVLGRSGVYYLDLIKGKKELDVITRRLENNQDDEVYCLQLNHAAEIAGGQLQFISSDLSLRSRSNITISKEGWFRISADEESSAEFSKKFAKLVELKGVKVESQHKLNYQVFWKGSSNEGETWDENWLDSPQKMGKVNAVWLKMVITPPKISIAEETLKESGLIVDDVKLIET